MKIRKLLKETCESEENKPSSKDLVVKIAIFEHKADSQPVPLIYLYGNTLLSLVSSNISNSTSSGQSHAPRTFSLGFPPPRHSSSCSVCPTILIPSGKARNGGLYLFRRREVRLPDSRSKQSVVLSCFGVLCRCTEGVGCKR